MVLGGRRSDRQQAPDSPWKTEVKMVVVCLRNLANFAGTRKSGTRKGPMLKE